MSNVIQRKNKTNGCPVCGAPSQGGLCSRHRKAVERLGGHYAVWKERLGSGISWEVFLTRIASNDNAGTWIKEAASYALKSGLTEPKDPNA